jgi:hypothetical protein
MWNHFEESGEAILGRLAGLLGVTAEELESSIGSNWTSTSATPNLLIRGDDMGVLFFDDENDDEEQGIEQTYPDIGMLVEYPDRIHIGTLKGVYNPAPMGYDIKTLITLTADADLNLQKLGEAIESVAQAFKAGLKACRYCKEKIPSYYMSEGGYCYSCGSKELGIVY